MFCDKKRLEVR